MMWLALALLGVLALLLATLVPYLWPRRGLTRGESRFWRAYYATLKASVPWGDSVPVQEVMDELALMLEATPRWVRRGLSLATWAGEWLPLMMGVSWRRFSSLPVARRVEVLAKVARSHHLFVAALSEALQAVGILVLAGHPRVLAVSGVARAEHVAACRAARAAGLAGP